MPNGDVYSVLLVEKAVTARPGNPAPVYPASLRMAQIEGAVMAHFVVDTAGRVEPPSITFPRAAHTLFEAAVRDALLHSRYVAAEAAGHRVRQLVEQRFEFRVSTKD